MALSPGDIVLMAYVPTPADLRLAQEAHWYRIPRVHVPPSLRYARVLALYQGAAFAEERWQVRWWAYIEGLSLHRRRELLPEQRDHPRANEWYVKVHLSPLNERRPPLKACKGRRLLFKTLTWSRFVATERLDEIFEHYSIEQDPFYKIIQAQLSDEHLYSIHDPTEPHQRRLFEHATGW